MTQTEIVESRPEPSPRPSRPALEVLVVDDEPALRELVAEVLTDAGHRVTTAADAPEAMRLVAGRTFDVVLTDIRLPGGDGLSVFRLARREHPTTEVILMTAYGDVDEAVASIKEGALDYLTKPFEMDEITARLERVVERRRAKAPGGGRPPVEAPGAEVLLGGSPSMSRLRYRLESIAQSDAPVLIVGEPGTGREDVARRIHELGPRRNEPFVAVSSAAFPEAVLGAELFGHARGAFAGAQRPREGRFRDAHGGTLFVDDVSELPPSAQEELLGWLQEGRIVPVGGGEPVAADVRLLTGSEQRALEARLAGGRFRQDLYFRLATLDLALPPLRDRRGDLPLLVETLLRELAPTGEEPPSVSPRAWAALTDYRYPGNLRELRHALEHARVLARSRASHEIQIDDLPAEIAGRPGSPPQAVPSEPRTLLARMKLYERECLVDALRQTGGRKAQAAQLLGISRKSLWKKLRQHGLAQAEAEERDAQVAK